MLYAWKGLFGRIGIKPRGVRRLLGAAIRNDAGATAIEYGLIAGSISLAIVCAVPVIGEDIAAWFQKLVDAL